MGNPVNSTMPFYRVTLEAREMEKQHQSLTLSLLYPFPPIWAWIVPHLWSGVAKSGNAGNVVALGFALADALITLRHITADLIRSPAALSLGRPRQGDHHSDITRQAR